MDVIRAFIEFAEDANGIMYEKNRGGVNLDDRAVSQVVLPVYLCDRRELGHLTDNVAARHGVRNQKESQVGENTCNWNRDDKCAQEGGRLGENTEVFWRG
jgi:hypothetical protein